jgi:hypothetical protein
MDIRSRFFMMKKLFTGVSAAALMLPAAVAALEPYAQCIADAGINETAVAACLAQYTATSTYTGPPETQATGQQVDFLAEYKKNPAFVTCYQQAQAASSGYEAQLVLCMQAYPITTSATSTGATTVSVTITPATTTQSTTQSTTQPDNQAEIARYLTMVAQLRQIIDQLTTAPASGASAKPSCSASRSMERGMSGEDVRELQTLLIARGFLDAGNDTGFFGPLTEEAVQELQIALGIVSSGTPEETGFGQAGPQTRAALGICI